MAILTLLLATAAGAQAQAPAPVADDAREISRPEPARSLALAGPKGQREPVDPERYVVGPGDRFAVAVRMQGGEVEIVPVSPEGELVLPQVGAVAVAGQTLAQAKRSVADALGRVFRNVRVDVALAAVRTVEIHVTGRVELPGTYSASALDVVSTLVELAGGLSEGAGRRNIRLRDADGSIRRVDLVRYAHVGARESNPPIMDAVSIHVPFEGPHVFCYGAVEEPGHYELAPGDDILSLVEVAGGLVESARRDSVEVREFVSDQETRHQLVSLDDPAVRDWPLKAGDQIYVRYRGEDYREIETVWVDGEGVRFPGPYGINEGQARLRDVIERAGGFTDDASLIESRLIRTIGVETEDREFERLRAIPVQDMSETEYQYFKTRSRERKGQVVVDFVKLADGDESQNHELRRGDHIHVPRNRTTVTVTGSVAAPGLVTYLPEMKASYYIGRAGGYSSDAKKSKTRVIKAATGEWEPVGDAGFIVPGDEIWVPEKPDRDWWRLTRETVAFVASVATVYLVIDQATN